MDPSLPPVYTITGAGYTITGEGPFGNVLNWPRDTPVRNGGSVLTRFKLKGKNAALPQSVSIGHIPGKHVPVNSSFHEWIVYDPGTPVEAYPGWMLFDYSFAEDFKRTFGTAEFRPLSLQIRGPVSVSAMNLYRKLSTDADSRNIPTPYRPYILRG